MIVYTSGTTGPPKGAVLPRRAIASNLDALADAWAWTGDDVLAHALPLFHVHGLILGVLGPLRLGGTVHHLVRFDSAAMAAELGGPATMMFGVPTMYNRLAGDAEEDQGIAEAIGRARVLVSGSAPLPAAQHARIERLSGQRIVERYGMSETLMNTAVRFDGERRAGTVGLPLPGVDLRLVDDDGAPIDATDDETVGEIQVRGPNLFLEYLNRPDATAEVMRDGWFATGDMATRAGDGYIRIVGRRATDLIKSGGYKIGAGEIEGALMEHPGVRGGRGDRRAGRRPRRAHRGVGRPRRRRAARGEGARGPCRPAPHAAQAAARRALPRRAAPQRDGEGRQEGTSRMSSARGASRGTRHRAGSSSRQPTCAAAATRRLAVDQGRAERQEQGEGQAGHEHAARSIPRARRPNAVRQGANARGDGHRSHRARDFLVTGVVPRAAR